MSDSDDENIIRYGTPLEAYDEDDVPSKKKFQKDSTDQYAIDDQGRRRFHGAFTGGFSAGFGNSVGTPEGFIPATFKSSRTEKAQKSNRRPEDFMDEEDRSEFGIAPRLVQTQSDFSGQKRPHPMRFHDGPIPGEPVLQQMVRAVHETAAVRMLKAMGWRPGQGAGERLTAAEKQCAGNRRKVYGCLMPSAVKDAASDHDSNDSEVDYETLFAPDDYEPYLLSIKSDRFGLGYSGLSRHSVLGNLAGEYGGPGPSRSHLVTKDKGKKVSIRGQAFGVGALENDDEDIYATEDMSHYDFALGGPTQEDKKKPVKKGSDGVLGFVRSSRVISVGTSHPPPALPRGFTPAPARSSRFDTTTARGRDQGLGRHDLTAEARGQILGESETTPTLPTPPTKEDSLTKILGRSVNFVSTNETMPTKKDIKPVSTLENSKEEDFISIKPTGKDLPKVFKPFAADMLKQRRYEKFLESGASETGVGLSEWERDRERLEFEQAAKLYKPLTGFMEDRFTHATETDEQPTNPLAAVAKSKNNKGLATKEQIEAAASGLYGVMTRSKGEWHPDPLVCKRFNVPHPYNAARAEPKNEKSKISYSIFEHLDSSVHNKESFKKDQATFSGSRSSFKERSTEINKSDDRTGIVSSVPNTLTAKKVEITQGSTKRMTVAELFLKESEKLVEESNPESVTETIKQFDRMELYKSIFLSDSENDNAHDEVNENEAEESDFRDVPKNVERNLSPPRGIFANIDFEELNSWNRSGSGEAKKPAENDKVEVKETELDESNLYGPKIPENLQKRLQNEAADDKERDKTIKPSFRSKSERDKAIEINSSSSSDSWVEEKEVKSKKLKKKKNKKHKHKKSKHKKKDR